MELPPDELHLQEVVVATVVHVEQEPVTLPGPGHHVTCSYCNIT